MICLGVRCQLEIKTDNVLKERKISTVNLHVKIIYVRFWTEADENKSILFPLCTVSVHDMCDHESPQILIPCNSNWYVFSYNPSHVIFCWCLQKPVRVSTRYLICAVSVKFSKPLFSQCVQEILTFVLILTTRFLLLPFFLKLPRFLQVPSMVFSASFCPTKFQLPQVSSSSGLR